AGSSACRRCRRYPRHKEFSSDPRSLPLDAPADLAAQQPQHLVAIALLNDTLHTSIEPVAVGVREILCGAEHHRHILPLRSSAKRIEELEPIHLRHQQVEDDHVWSPASDRLDGKQAILCLGHLPPRRLERLAYSATDYFIIVNQKGSPGDSATKVGQGRCEL